MALGLGSGFIGGMLGIGGGVVIVPTLALVYEVNDRFETEQQLIIAVATSLACIIFTSASAAYKQFLAGKVRWDLYQKLVAPLLLGGFLAGFVGSLLPAFMMQLFIGLFLAMVALIMLRNWQPNATQDFPKTTGAVLIGTTGGMASGLAGIAGGNIIVPTLVYFNTPVHQATATSSALGVPIALVATLGYLNAAPHVYQLSPLGDPLIGYIDLYAFAPIVLGAVLAAPIGVKYAHAVPGATLKRYFGGLLVGVSANILWGAFSNL